MRCIILSTLLISLLPLLTTCTTKTIGDPTSLSIPTCTNNVYNFGAPLVNTTTNATFSLVNAGTSDANAIAVKGLTPPFAFAGGSFPGTGGTCTSLLHSGESCTFVITFAPVLTGLMTLPVGVIFLTGNSANATGCGFYGFSRGVAGELDTSFGTNGKVTTTFGTGENFAYGAFQESSGSITVLGATHNGHDYDLAIARYLPTGAIDSQFGTNGSVIASFGTDDDYGVTPILLSDGSFFVTGYYSNGSYTNFLVMRYHSDGSLDTGFGTSGKISASVSSGNNTLVSSVLDTNGRLVLAGFGAGPANSDIGIARFNTNGSLDTSFFTAGKALFSIGTSHDYLGGISLQTDGNLVLTGWHTVAPNFLGFVTRLLSNGSLDTSFATSGTVVVSFDTGNNWLTSVSQGREGKLSVAGRYTNASADDDLAVLRLDTNGTADSSFGVGGKKTTHLNSGNEGLTGIKIDEEGNLVSVGYAPYSASNDFLVMRYLSDGSLDSTFGTQGATHTDLMGFDDSAVIPLIQTFGVTVIGSANGSSSHSFALVRYWQ